MAEGGHHHRFASKRPRDPYDDRELCKRPMGSSSPVVQSLSVLPHLYDRAFPLYQQPVELGCFSLDAKRSFFNDDRQLRYFVDPGKWLEFDLRDGYHSRFIRRDETVKEKLDHLLKWILQNQHKTHPKDSSKGRAVDVDFVTWRGHLTKVLTTPYERQEGWAMAATLFNGTIYLSEVETEEARASREARTDRDQEMMYWGYKFEQYMCAEKVEGAPDPGGVVNTNEAFCTVVQTRLVCHTLLFSGEVDCRLKDPKAPPAPGCYVELKTSAEIRTSKQRSNFLRYKLIKWWAQSFLPGVPLIVAGFRDKDGIVASVETFKTSKISQMIKSEYETWKPTVCMNFCNDFLSFVKSVVREDNPGIPMGKDLCVALD
ncbi:hypothetical protein DNTS_027365, partial [Danionella cerebrum]